MNPTNKETQSNTDQGADTSMDIQDLDSIKKSMKMMDEKISMLEEKLKLHNHTGKDGSEILHNSLDLRPTEDIQIGNFRLQEISDLSGSNVQNGFLIVGKDKDDTTKSDNTQLQIQHLASTNGSTNRSFIFGTRPPLVTGANASVTSAGTTMVTNEFKFDYNELVGAQLVVYTSDASSFNSFVITSNKGNIITVNGAWTFTSAKSEWIIIMPVYLGAAEYPWRQIYAGGDDVSSASDGSKRRAIRLGHGPTSGRQGIYFGSGTPEASVTAVIGSLYLRSDGSTTTTLYIKTSGTGNTGWTAK